ncbi:unnamed protein product [Rhizophagus irregularis]|nr:unnamed protein product [Rhizophagus irregularis]
MKIVNITNYKKSFDPTPRLKSSPIPIKFISFSELDNNCIYCGEEYTRALLCSSQKYCKKCLSQYINDITDNNMYLDVYIYTMDLECKEHEISRSKVPQSIQECCGNCVRILCFKQMNGYISFNVFYKNLYNKVIESERNCKLCGKSLHQGTGKWNSRPFKLCSVCYRISSELIESTLVKKQISILYLPWWYNNTGCKACYSRLTFTSKCQKYCAYCYIFYVGCRYCLTTNIIFGPIEQSQCKKCKRISVIINSSVKCDIDDFLLYNVILDNLDKLKKKIKSATINKYFIPINILGNIFRERCGEIKWIPYSQFTDVKEIAKGGYGIIYKAIWLSNNETIVLKRFNNSKNIGKDFLNELKSLQHCIKNNLYLIKTYGFTKDPKLEDYILVMKYASEGDLHKYLQKEFTRITWNKVLSILVEISSGLNSIHNANFIHRDFHSGNILFVNNIYNIYDNGNRWPPKLSANIGDLGLSQAVNSKTSNNEIYGVIPYIAPEIFEGFKFTQKADIYSLGMIMWEFTTGCKPFDNVKHDYNLIYKILDGERPNITEDTPECYANLMKSCWDPDPKKRPFISDICSTFRDWAFRGKITKAEFNQANAKKMELIKSKKIGPEFAERRHSEAIYTSRPLSALISKYSSTYSSSAISFDSNYISAELELDIDTESIGHGMCNLLFFISSSQNLSSSAVQNFSTSLKKRKHEVLTNFETHDNGGKRIKTSSSYP